MSSRQVTLCTAFNGQRPLLSKKPDKNRTAPPRVGQVTFSPPIYSQTRAVRLSAAVASRVASGKVFLTVKN